MQDNAGVDQKASVAELIALLRKAQEELEAHGDLNEVNFLLRERDLAREDRGSKNVCRDFSPKA
jgi:hypothetical protein